MLQTEEEFLAGLTNDFTEDPMDRDDDEDEEEDEDESEESDEEVEEEGRKESGDGGRKSKSIDSSVGKSADVGSMVLALQKEGESKVKLALIFVMSCVLCTGLQCTEIFNVKC